MANTEVEVIKFTGDVSDLKKELKSAETAFSSVENKGKTAAKNTESAFSKLGSSVKSALSSLPIGGLINDLDSAADSARSVGSGISEISGASSRAGSGVKALTALVGVGLLGAVTLVIGAFAAVVSFVKQTDEGGARLEATFAGVSAATDVLTGKLAQAGSSIADYFTEGEDGGKILDNVLGTLRISLAQVTFGASEAAIALGKTELAGSMKEAYDQAYALSLELDAIQDDMRLLSVESKQTDLQIQSLLKQAKNRGTDVTTRLGLITQAQELENSNLQKNFELQKRYYDNISQTNILKLESINSDNKAGVARVRAIADQIKQAKTADELLQLYREQVDAQEGLLSISDDLAQNQVNGLEKIIELAGKSEILSEKYAAIQSQLIEKDIAERTEAIKAVERERQAAALNSIKDADKLAKETLDIQIMSLEQQRALLKSYGKDVSQIDLDIATLKRKYEEDNTKKQADELAKRLAEEKAYSEAQRKLAEENYKKAIEDIDENTKLKTLQIRENAKTDEDARKEELKLAIGALQQKKLINEENGKSTLDIELELQAKKKELYAADVKDYEAAQAKKKQATINTIDFIATNTTSIYNGLAENQKARTQNELSDSQAAAAQKQKDLQNQLDMGLISQEKYNASLKQSQLRQAQTEATIKARQARADKENAIFNILINTAQAVAKTLASLGIPAGIPAAIIAGAAGAAQLAIVNARPLPRFKDGVIDMDGKGTGTSDSNLAMLSRGESVMTEKETKENLGLLWAVRNNKLDDYVNRAWVKPALDKADQIRKSKDQRYNKMMRKAIGRNADFDTSDLQRDIRRNKRVSIDNWDEMPEPMKGRRIV